MTPDSEWNAESPEPLVRIARVGKPHGIRGEVTVEVFTDSPETRFVQGNVFELKNQSSTVVPSNRLTLEQARWNKKILLLKFHEVSDRNSAELLRNSELFFAIDDASGQEDGWYADDLIGLAVHKDAIKSDKIGEVSNLITGEAQDLLEVRLLSGRKVLVPFVEEIVPEVDEHQGVIVITPPAGLLELTQD